MAIGLAILLPVLAEMTVRLIAQPPELANPYYLPEPRTDEQRAKANREMDLQQANYEQSRANFELLSFAICFPIGILELLLAYLLRKGTIAAGVAFGGLGTVAFTSFSNWDELPGLLRYLAMLFTLFLVLCLAWRIERESAALKQGPPD